jgi:hypothetical protein
MCRCVLTGRETVLHAAAADFAHSITAPQRIAGPRA